MIGSLAFDAAAGNASRQFEGRDEPSPLFDDADRRLLQVLCERHYVPAGTVGLWRYS
jgi:hypothetical protein